MPLVTPITAYSGGTPLLSNPETFDTNSDAWVAYQVSMISDINSMISEINALETVASLNNARETYTATLTDSQATPNASPTTYTADYWVHGDLVHLRIGSSGGWNDISTAGMTGGDALRLTLPHTTNGRAVGTVMFQNLATAMVGVHVYAQPSTSYANFLLANGIGGASTMTVSDLSTGASDILALHLTYRKA